MIRTMIGLAAMAVMVGATAAEAQQPTQPRRTRRTQTIEIRGQVPTPQVVTVRPREVPAYSRQVLVPNFYDHDFWPSIVQAYQMVPQRMLSGVALPDSAAADSSARPAGTPNAIPAGADTSRTRMTPPADTTGRTRGTAPARPPRR